MRDMTVPPSRKKATVVQAVGGYVNTGIVVVQGLILVPFYLYFIGAHTYGLWLASGGILGMLGLMNFGIGSVLVQRIASAYGKKSFALAGMYFINGMMVYLFICVLLGLVGWGVSIWIPSILKVTGDEAVLLLSCFQLAVVAMMLAVLNECLRAFSQSLLRPMAPVVGMVLGRIVGIGVTVWGLFNNVGLWAIPIGTLIAEFIILAVNLCNAVSLFRGLGAKVVLDRKIINEYVKTSPPLLMATTGNTISQEAEPLLITMFLTPEITAAYMVTRRAADIVFRMLNVIAGSTMGAFSHLVGSGDVQRTTEVVKKLLMLSYILGAIGFAGYVGANQAFISLWVGESFLLEQNITFFIALALFARTFRGLLGRMLYGLGDFTYTSVVIFLEGIVRVLLALGLLNTFGLIGVPLAFILPCLIAVLILGFRLKKQLVLSISFPAIGRLLLTAIVLFTASLGLLSMNLDVKSWGGFAIYLTGLLMVSSIICITMNRADFHDWYGNVFKWMR